MLPLLYTDLVMLSCCGLYINTSPKRATVTIMVRIQSRTVQHCTYDTLRPALLSNGTSYDLIYFSYFDKIEVGLCDYHAVCVPVRLRVCVSPFQLLNGCTNFYETWYIYHGT
jgi:hypothetical protein